jgi:hypothetical protein
VLVNVCAVLTLFDVWTALLSPASNSSEYRSAIGRRGTSEARVPLLAVLLNDVSDAKRHVIVTPPPASSSSAAAASSTATSHDARLYDIRRLQLLADLLVKVEAVRFVLLFVCFCCSFYADVFRCYDFC